MPFIDSFLSNSGDVHHSRVLIMDDHAFVAESVAAALSSPPRSFYVKTAGTLSEGLKELKTEGAFDLVLLDLKMPGMMGLKSIKEVILAASPGYVALFSGKVDQSILDLSIENGARGWIPKSVPMLSVLCLTDVILTGQFYVPLASSTASPSESEKLANLTEHETSFVEMASEGLTNKEIALAAGCSEVIVKMHMRSICRKLCARNRAHAVSIALARGLF